MKKILFIAAIFSVLGSQFTNAHGQQPDAIYKLLRYEWTLNSDGTSDYHYRHEVQILRNRALVAYADKGETFVVFNPDLEEVTVNEVYTLQKDGTRVNMPQNAFIYQLPSSCESCGRFNHLRELAMVHTGMELGCTIVVDYTIHRRYNFLYESMPIQRECPVEQLEVVVNYSSNDMEVKYAIDGYQYLNSDDVTRSESANTGNPNRVLRYTFRNLQQAPREPYMPDDIVPTLRLYNGTPEFTPAFDNARFGIDQDIMGVVAARGSQRERATAIRNYVVDNIHLNDIHPSHLGYTHATAEEVWLTGCGTATDKAVLTAALLNDEGFIAYVTGTDFDEVGVLIDTLEYRLSVRGKAPMTLYGEAKDEVVKQELNGTFDADLDTLEDGFYHLRLPAVGNTLAIDASRLALTRSVPLQGVACNLNSDITINLPKGMKMVGHNSTQTLNFDGIGSLELTVKQSGKKLHVVRKMKLDKSLVAPEDYNSYRQILSAWQSFGPILLQQK